jgi:hypothetical protein
MSRFTPLTKLITMPIKITVRDILKKMRRLEKKSVNFSIVTRFDKQVYNLGFFRNSNWLSEYIINLDAVTPATKLKKIPVIRVYSKR